MSYYAATMIMHNKPLRLPDIHISNTAILITCAVVFGIICIGIAWLFIDDWLVRRKRTEVERSRYVEMHNKYLHEQFNRKYIGK